MLLRFWKVNDVKSQRFKEFKSLHFQKLMLTFKLNCYPVKIWGAVVKLTAVVILTGPAVFYELVWIPLKNPILTFDLIENMLSDIVLAFF
jgi:hypothetical protein